MSETLRELHEELKRFSTYAVDFLQLPFLPIDDRLFLMDIHPHNPHKKPEWRLRQIYGHDEFKSNYGDDYEFLNIEKDILDEAYRNFEKKRVVKVVKKLMNNIHCITISPNPEFHQDEVYLNQVVSRVVRGCKVVKHYGVFERGSKNNLYHTHFLIEYENDKNCIQNLKKYFVKENRLKANFIYKVEKVGGPTHLLKCLRYMENDKKKNFGYFERQDSRKNLFELTNQKMPKLIWNLKINI